MIKSTPNVWYNIDELYTISSDGEIKLSVDMENGKGIYYSEEDITDLPAPIPNGENMVHLEDNTGATSDHSLTSGKNNVLSKYIFPEHVNGAKERCVWICISILIFFFFSFSGWNIYHLICKVFTHQYTKTVIGNVPATQIPFPAITLCNENKIIKRNVDNDVLSWFKEWELRQALCDLEVFGNPPDSIVHDNDIINKALLKFSPALAHFLHTCTFGNLNCYNHFQPVFTDDGLCFTFNGINESLLFSPQVMPMSDGIQDEKFVEPVYNYDWNPESGYIQSFNCTSSEMYPKSVASNKHEFTLQMMMKEDSEEITDESCRGSNDFKEMLNKMIFGLITVVILATLHSSNAAKILSIFPTPSFSHQQPLLVLSHALAARGHKLTVITPSPSLRFFVNMNGDDLTEEPGLSAQKTLAWSIAAIVMLLGMCTVVAYAGVQFVIFIILAVMAVLSITYITAHFNADRRRRRDQNVILNDDGIAV